MPPEDFSRDKQAAARRTGARLAGILLALAIGAGQLVAAFRAMAHPPPLSAFVAFALAAALLTWDAYASQAIAWRPRRPRLPKIALAPKRPALSPAEERLLREIEKLQSENNRLKEQLSEKKK